MAELSGFISMLSEQQLDQLLKNLKDFDITDPDYLLIMDRAGSRKSGEDDETQTQTGS